MPASSFPSSHCGVGLADALGLALGAGVALGLATGVAVALGDGELTGVAEAAGVGLGVGLGFGCMFVAFLSFTLPSGSKTTSISLFCPLAAKSAGTATSYFQVDPRN
jgi:Na+-driven multidrug efflux pump